MNALAERVRERRRQERSPGRVREILAQAQVTQAEVAEALGVDAVTVSRWLRGVRRPRGVLAAQYHELVAELEDALS